MLQYLNRNANHLPMCHPQVLQALLRTTDRIVQQIDSVEYGLTDIQVRQMLPCWYLSLCLGSLT